MINIKIIWHNNKFYSKVKNKFNKKKLLKMNCTVSKQMMRIQKSY